MSDRAKGFMWLSRSCDYARIAVALGMMIVFLVLRRLAQGELGSRRDVVLHLVAWVLTFGAIPIVVFVVADLSSGVLLVLSEADRSIRPLVRKIVWDSLLLSAMVATGVAIASLVG
mgnify:CR=1 FL=1